MPFGAGARRRERRKPLSIQDLRLKVYHHRPKIDPHLKTKIEYNMDMNEMNSDFDPTLPTDRTPATEWDQPMDEADSYVDYDEVSDGDADWRWESEQDDTYILEDSWDDESGLASAGFGMDESY